MSPSQALVRSYLHRAGTRALLGYTIDDYLKKVVDQHGAREALVSLPQGRRLTYQQLDREVDRLARGLLALGLDPGDRVGIWSTNNVEWVLLQLATARVGVVLVNVNPAYRRHELEHVLRLSRLRALFLIPSFRTSDYVTTVTEVCPELGQMPATSFRSQGFPELEHVVVYDPADAENTLRPASGFLLWQEVLRLGEEVAEAAVRERSAQLDPDDPVNIQFTSGTTGFPKGVVLTHHNILNNGFDVAETLDLTAEDRLCVTVPFYHCFGMVISNLGCLTHGATLVIPAEHFDAKAVLEAVAAERCTVLHGVPTMFIAELEHPDFASFDVSSLRTGIMAGAPCPAELARRVIGDLGIYDLLIAYGQTEASPVTHMTRAGDSFERRVETVGTNMPHLEVKVIDVESGAVTPVGRQGEVCYRGYSIMRGYFGQPEETRQAIDEAGWLHSGDLGVMDADGYLKITGRIKDMIIRGGENIYPAEIEASFFRHPKIAEVAVFGVPDQRFGEEVGAWVKLHEGETAEPEELRLWAKSRMAHYKVPRHVWVVDEFPRTVTGKIQKFRIRERAAAEVETTEDVVA